MSAALLAESDLLAGLPIWALPGPGEAPDTSAVTEGLCPICEHPLRVHRRVYPWDDPPMLLCFVLVAGERCFGECGTCRKEGM